MTAYYNEIEEAAAHVLRAQIAAGVIAPGDVDTRSIKEVHPDDLRGYTQCHFFAGGGLWSVAARLAGWPDDRPLWTGSCPCQPFSVAGKGAGVNDPRHLWPDFFRLVRAARPPVVVGEQVAGAAGYGWFDGVSADLEREDYASRAVDVPACAVDAPHIRQRLYWVARSLGDADGARADIYAASGPSRATVSERGVRVGDSESLGRRGRSDDEDGRRRQFASADTGAGSGGLEHAASVGRAEGRPEHEFRSGRSAAPVDGLPDGTGVAQGDADRAGCREHGRPVAIPSQLASAQRAGGSFWRDAELRIGADGKARRVKPGVRLLVDGLPGRVGLLRIGGNAIVPQVAAEVLASLMDVSC